MMPKKVQIVEVGPRDGLQNEKTWISTKTKILLINKLAEAGLKKIEATSFVSPKWIPQMNDAFEVMLGIERQPGVTYPVLIPNMEGFERAMETNITEIAIFITASEEFSQKNVNCSITESIKRFRTIIQAATKNKIRTRGYISCVLGCPYQGEVPLEIVESLAEQLFELGCYEISLGDTIGVGTPIKAKKMLERVAKKNPISKLAVHFHDTRGQALANIYSCLELGVNVIDSSISGLGGCPYANGATGNVATEDLVYMLNGMGIETGINIEKLIEVSNFISNSLDRNPQSKLALLC